MLRCRFTFRGQRFDIPDEIEQHYLQNILQREVQNNKAATIVVVEQTAQHARRLIILRQKGDAATPNQSPVIEEASPRLQKLLNWANQIFSIEVHKHES